MSARSFHPSLLRLLQITSPSLPVGGYSYSQGLEWAVDAGWVSDASEFGQWLEEQLDGVMARQDLPLFIRAYRACDKGDQQSAEYWDAIVMAMRETAELRHEEEQRGRALMALLKTLPVSTNAELQSQISAFAAFCVAEHIPLNDALTGFTYSWLDSQVTAAIKLVPLGQSEGQGLLYRTSELIPAAISCALLVDDENIGYTSPALTMASCLHETQYSRLFRS